MVHLETQCILEPHNLVALDRYSSRSLQPELKSDLSSSIQLREYFSRHVLEHGIHIETVLLL